jgi:hypothetical protein
MQIYMRPSPMPELPEMLFLLLFSLHDAYAFQRRLSLLERRDTRAPDAVALACGIATLLQQYHPSYFEVRPQTSLQSDHAVSPALTICWPAAELKTSGMHPDHAVKGAKACSNSP